MIADQPACQVYMANDVLLDRPAALKVLKKSHRNDTDVSSRFRLEGRILAKLRHPNIVHLYGFHEIESLPCLAMEFVDGGTLADVIKRGPIPVAAAVQVLLRISRAVAAAHRLGIVHRDLKPHNILIDTSIIEPALDTPIGFIKVADFGIARIIESFESLTLTGMQPGSAYFMAPEQVEARSRDICAATDVFSLGAILHTMLAGVSPFAAPSVADSLHRIVHEASPRLSDSGLEIPDELEVIFSRCLQKDPKLRFRDAEELANELAAVLPIIEISRKSSWTPFTFLLAFVFIVLAMFYRVSFR